MPPPEQTFAPKYPAVGAGETPANAAAGFDLRWILAFLWRRAWIIAVVFAVTIIAVAAVYLAAPRTYVATSTVLLDRSKFKVVESIQDTTDPVLDSAAVDTEVQVLKSPELAARVATKLDLAKSPEFNPGLTDASPGGIQGIIAKLTHQTPAPPPTGDALGAAIVNKLLKGADISRVGLTYAIQVRYESTSPQTAALLANTIAREYVASQLDAEVSATQDASTLVQQRLGDLRGQVIDAENAAQRYRSSNGLLGTGISEQSLTQQEISTLNTQLAQAMANQAEQQARLDTARQQLAGGSNGEDVGQALNSPVIAQLRGRRADISREVADLRATHGPSWPALVTAQSQLTDIDSQIQAEVRRIISNLEAEAQVARDRTASIERSLQRSKGSLSTSSNAQVKLNDLDRNVDSVSSLYQSFLDRYKETTVQQGTERPQAKLIGIAAIPRSPASPQPILFLGGGFLAASVLALAAALLMEAMENGLTTSREIERVLGVRAMASIPELGSTLDRHERSQFLRDPSRYVVLKPLSGFSESFRSLRASLGFSRQDRAVQLIVVTSALPGEGKTTSAVALGRSYALAGYSVIIVDADVRRPNLARVANLQPGPGLMEVLRGQNSLESAVVKDTITDVRLLQAGLEADGDLILSDQMDRLIETLRGQYGIVIIDTAPVLPVAETRVLASKADAVLFLTRWRKTPALAAVAAIHQLQSVDAYIAGAALSNVNVRKQARFGYGDAAFYYDAYKKYYTA